MIHYMMREVLENNYEKAKGTNLLKKILVECLKTYKFT
jgi:hypothetical protein